MNRATFFDRIVTHFSAAPAGAALTLSLALLCGGAAVAAESQTDRGAAEPATPAAVYGQGVRETGWQSPADEQAGFHLPAGFEVRLFASEPQITKPLNMAFDAQGQLWLTESVEYPYPASDPSAASDAVMILSDTDGDGRADQFTRFADGLNIPIGILPYGDGCLCFSIPNILYLRDTDGDRVCDRREVILGPFDTTRDTHGMINAMRMGNDGWVYACHGFNNQSEVTGRDGHTVRMSSGNTFRFRPDGSRVEVVTHGQVNPFGMTTDQWGYRYSADCHSKPITQLIRGACYPSFGRPHDGLGFLPPMVDHLHGSTAICGILHFSPESPIVPLRNQMLSGNVMTSRLNRNRVHYHGATAIGEALPDFMTSDDPWFRPVDLRLGTDGFIYVADFYNKIIGHYEVPLNHPGRDRKSGRIWQIRYHGAAETNDPVIAASDPTKEPTTREPTSVASGSDRWIDRICSVNPTVRKLASLDAASHGDQAAAVAFDGDQPSYARVAAIAALRSAGSLDGAALTRLAADDDPRVQVEALRLAAELPQQTRGRHQALVDALDASDPRVVQAAAETLGLIGTEDDVESLFETLAHVPAEDHVLRQTLRIALRNLYRESDPDSQIWHRTADAEFASIMLGLQRPEMIEGLLKFLSHHPDSSDRDQVLMHAARHATEETLARCIELARQSSDQVERQFQLLGVLAESVNARPDHVPTAISDWATQLVEGELDRYEQNAGGDPIITWVTEQGEIWPTGERELTNGTSLPLVDSIQRGEQYTGTLVSAPFTAPPKISFWLAGHNGMPGKPDHQKNRIRLVDLSEGEVVHESFPPRNDVAVRIHWDTSAIVGHRVQIECVDGDSANAYAWLAIGGFEPPWLMNIEPSIALGRANGWTRRLGLNSMEPRLLSIFRRDALPRKLRINVAEVITSLRSQTAATVLLRFLAQTRGSDPLDEQVITACLDGNDETLREAAKSLTKELTSAQQRAFAGAWVQQGADVEMLLQMTRDGWISPVALADRDVAQTLAAKLSPSQRQTFESLTRQVDSNSEQQRNLARLRQALPSPNADAVNGHAVFKKHCAACHQLRGEGVVVGPQLDGAAVRSADRLLEDVVTPDQNVDQAFRTTSFLLEDGRVQVGLVRDETDGQITIVDSKGKPITIDPALVEQRRAAGRSLMPGNFGEVISPQDFADMLAYIRGE